MQVNDLWKLMQEILPVLAMICGPLLAWGLWSLRNKFVPREECALKLGAREEDDRQFQQMLVSLERRQTETEARLDHLPQIGSVYKIQLDMERLRGEMNTLKKEMDGQKEILIRVERMLNLLTEAHMKGDK